MRSKEMLSQAQRSAIESLIRLLQHRTGGDKSIDTLYLTLLVCESELEEKERIIIELEKEIKFIRSNIDAERIGLHEQIKLKDFEINNMKACLQTIDKIIYNYENKPK